MEQDRSAKAVEIRKLAGSFPSKAMSNETATLYQNAVDQVPLSALSRAVDWLIQNYKRENLPPIALLLEKCRELGNERGDLAKEIKGKFIDRYEQRVGKEPVPYVVCSHRDTWTLCGAGCTLTLNDHRRRRACADDIWDELRKEYDNPDLGPARTTEKASPEFQGIL